jgi:hypothetical protein
MLTRQRAAAIREDLEEVRRWGDLDEIAQMEEQLEEFRAWQEHCHEGRFEAEREDARCASYWEQYDA